MGTISSARGAAPCKALTCAAAMAPLRASVARSAVVGRRRRAAADRTGRGAASAGGTGSSRRMEPFSSSLFGRRLAVRPCGSHAWRRAPRALPGPLPASHSACGRGASSK